MDPKKQLADLMQKPMSRKAFLAHIGAAMLAMLGISGFIRNLSDPHRKTTKQADIVSQSQSNYNGGAYGGQRK